MACPWKVQSKLSDHLDRSAEDVLYPIRCSHESWICRPGLASLERQRWTGRISRLIVCEMSVLVDESLFYYDLNVRCYKHLQLDNICWLLTWHVLEAPPLAACLEFRSVTTSTAQADTHGVANVHFLSALLHLEHGL